MSADDLAATHAAAFQNARGWSAAEFTRLLAQDTTLLIGDAASFILASIVLDEAEILTVATHPENQRQGRAHANFADLDRQLAEHSVTRIFLEVAADNQSAITLYTQLGFAKIATRSGYYHRSDRPAVDAEIYEKKLNAR